ncbi:hypothetical protein Rsub_09443 [Raphidocelis subcapitata]|uniref:Glycoside hydrolase n=1 Tax=Raphidocelis subcapitata TaxID=307507 RepID=A0A2V0PA27_9CHLO|nr:hypothetical protein Rsub_09443 [Raphidocelis subcapitata]|eukprot:GBF96701.1 hypothetical protein Rsub_09443 [Raphidocelis subcapitata]
MRLSDWGGGGRGSGAGGRRCARPLAPLLLLLAAGAFAVAAAASVPLSSSVLLFYDCEYEPHYGQPISQCDLLLQRAKEAGSNSVQLVPTHYWVDGASSKLSPGGCYPENWRMAQKVDYYCSHYEWDKPCEAFTKDSVARFAAGFKACLQKAHDSFEEVLITPHLDDGTKTMHWRNFLRFDPLKPDAKGFSYWDVMLAPIVDGIKAVYKEPGRRVTLAAQGEMGATVFFHPAAHKALADRIRSAYKGPSKLDLALFFNGGMIAGVVNRGADPVRKPDALSARAAGAGGAGGGDALASVWGPLKPLGEWPDGGAVAAGAGALRGLLDSMDVLGTSCYPRTSVPPQPSEFETCLQKVDEELSAVGFDLKTWVSKPGKRIELNEVGLGGGIDPCKGVPASSPAEAGSFGWAGTGYPWTPETDPWSRPDLKQYRRDWHAALLKLLAARGGRYPISGAYLWSILSHDPQGIHPATSTDKGSFKDDAIAAAIKAHNAGGGAAGRRAGGRGARRRLGIHPATSTDKGSFKDDVIAAAIKAHNAGGGAAGRR